MYCNGREEGFRLYAPKSKKVVLFSEGRNYDSLVIYLTDSQRELTDDVYVNKSRCFYCYENDDEKGEKYNYSMIERAIDYMLGYLEV